MFTTKIDHLKLILRVLNDNLVVRLIKRNVRFAFDLLGLAWASTWLSNSFPTHKFPLHLMNNHISSVKRVVIRRYEKNMRQYYLELIFDDQMKTI